MSIHNQGLLTLSLYTIQGKHPKLRKPKKYKGHSIGGCMPWVGTLLPLLTPFKPKRTFHIYRKGNGAFNSLAFSLYTLTYKPVGRHSVIIQHRGTDSC